MLLFAQAPRPRSIKTTGCNIFAQLSLAQAHPSAKIYYAPLPPLSPAVLTALSEAARLTFLQSQIFNH